MPPSFYMDTFDSGLLVSWARVRQMDLSRILSVTVNDRSVDTVDMFQRLVGAFC